MGYGTAGGTARLWVSVAALVLSMCLAPSQAEAACEGFSIVADTCPPGVGLKGCCEEDNVAQWCDEGTLCRWDCSKEAQASVCGWEVVGPTGHYICREAFAEDPSGQSPVSCDDAGGCPCVEIECGFDYSPSNVDSPGCFCGLCGAGLTCDTDTGACVCIPTCAGKQCGLDGCGGDCGACAQGGTCTSQGLCTSVGCEPDCWGKECGADGCGELCGQCSADSFCQDGSCFAGCAADCTAKDCGDDGCGGSCGLCLETAICTDAGKCQLNCAPSCEGRDCGDDGCGGLCGVCSGSAVCSPVGICSGGPECSCVGRFCGDDGCGTNCGDCYGNTTCDVLSGQCDPTGEGDQRVCPPGTLWNRWAETCAVVEDSMTVSSPGEPGGCAGSNVPTGLLWFAALFAGLLRFRGPE